MLTLNPNETLPTSQKLVSALEGELLLTGDQRLKAVIQRAKANYYHDFFGVPATPEIELHALLIHLGHPKLAQRVANGDFDASKEESDMWARSKDGQETFKRLLDRK